MSIIQDRIFEVSSMKLSACNLGKEIDDLTSFVHALAEAVLDMKFLTMLNCNSPFLKEIVAAMMDEFHTVETWTSFR